MHTSNSTPLTQVNTAENDWMLVQMNQFQLLLPRADTVTLAPLEGNPQLATKQCGTMTCDQVRYPVFCLDSNLRLAPMGSSHCRVALLLNTGKLEFALACQNLNRLESLPAVRYQVPSCMRGRRQPFEEFTLIEGRPAPFTSALALARLLVQLGVKFTPGTATGYQQETA